jgi:F420-dependent oxidoreductase-like protein
MAEAHRGASYHDQLALAQAAERLGYPAFFRTEHFLAIDGDGRPGPTDSWVTLGALARETSAIRLGTIMTSITFRHPALLAVQVAQVDQMSGGRVELGLGCGWFEAEHRAMGVPFPPMPERFDRFEEQVEIITGLWGTPDGARFDYTGTYHVIEGNPALPKPVQPGGPPLIVGGFGTRRTPRIAAQYGTEFNSPFSAPHETARQITRVRAACEGIGRDPLTLHYSIALQVCCASTGQQVRRRLEKIGQAPERFAARGVAGSPAEVTDRIAAYAGAGATRCYLALADLSDLDQLELIATDVMPHLRTKPFDSIRKAAR